MVYEHYTVRGLSIGAMAPDLLFHRIFDEAKATLAGVSNCEVVHPPRSIGLIRLITLSIGCDRFRSQSSDYVDLDHAVLASPQNDK
jgi:hypothetical protein